MSRRVPIRGAPLVQSSHVEPELLECSSNNGQRCLDHDHRFGETWVECKVEPPTDGEFSDGVSLVLAASNASAVLNASGNGTAHEAGAEIAPGLVSAAAIESACAATSEDAHSAAGEAGAVGLETDLTGNEVPLSLRLGVLRQQASAVTAGDGASNSSVVGPEVDVLGETLDLNITAPPNGVIPLLFLGVTVSAASECLATPDLGLPNLGIEIGYVETTTPGLELHVAGSDTSSC